MNIQILLFDGFDELDAIAPFEVLQNAKSAGAALSVQMVTLEDPRLVTASHGLTVQSQGQLQTSPQPPALLMVPGGNWNFPADTGVRKEVESGEIPPQIAAFHQAGGVVAAVCTGAMLLAAADILKHRHAITHHAAVDDLQATGANIIRQRVVDDGDIITAGGVTSGLDLALWLVEREAGAKIANEVAARMEYTTQGDVWQRP